MRQALLTGLLFLGLPVMLWAGSGGPDAYGYYWRDNLEPNGPVFAWYDISQIGTLVSGMGDDNTIGPLPIATGFQFYWYQTEQLWIGSNGFIGFSANNIASPFPSIPATSGVNDFIAPFLSDLIHGMPGSNAQVFYHVQGDTICVSWLNVPFWQAAAPSYTGSNSFQVILNKADKSITFNYLNQTGSTNGNDITVGIENISGAVGLQHSKNVYPIANRSIKFYYPDTVTYQAIDGGVNWNMSAGNGGVFIKKGVPTTLTTNIKNFGNTPLTNIAINSSVSFLGTPSVNNTATVASLSAGSDTLVALSNTITPLNDGVYDMTTTISGITGDMVAANNTIRTKIISVDTSFNSIILEYSDNNPNGTGLSWSGGSGGIGYYIDPGFYPAKIDNYRVWIVSDAANTGCYLKIFDDDGPNGTPGTMLDSTFMAPGSFSTGTYATPALSNTNLIIQEGGFYVLWEMPTGANIQIARDTDLPISYRAMEYLQGNWASYRARFSEDFLLGVQAQQWLVRDIELTEVIEPTPGSTVNGPTSPKIVIKNLGNLPNNVASVNYRFGALPPVSENLVANSLQPGDSIIYTFSVPLNSPIQQTANLCIWLNMTGDISRSNDTSCASITFVPQATSVAEETLNPIRTYPNPAADYLHFDFGDWQGKAQLQVYDLQGRRMGSWEIAVDEPYRLQVNEWADGLYQYVLVYNERQYTGRLMKSQP